MSNDGSASRGRPAPRVVVPAPGPQPRATDRPADRTTGRPAPPARPAAPAPRPFNEWDLRSAQQQPQHAPGTAWQQMRETAAEDQVQERGLPAWAALIVLLAIVGLGGLVDAINGSHVRGGFNVGIVIASIAAILLVRHSAMFPVVVAPPIVYSVVSGILLYVRSNGLHDRKVLIDTAANWLVYGFPAIAAASAAVLIIAGIRIVIRR